MRLIPNTLKSLRDPTYPDRNRLMCPLIKVQTLSYSNVRAPRWQSTKESHEDRFYVPFLRAHQTCSVAVGLNFRPSMNIKLCQVVPGGHPSKYSPGSTLLHFDDRMSSALTTTPRRYLEYVRRFVIKSHKRRAKKND